MTTLKLKIAGMSCQHCVGVVKTALEKLTVGELEVTVGEASFQQSVPSSREVLKTMLDDLGFDLTEFEVVAAAE